MVADCVVSIGTKEKRKGKFLDGLNSRESIEYSCTVVIVFLILSFSVDRSR